MKKSVLKLFAALVFIAALFSVPQPAAAQDPNAGACWLYQLTCWWSGGTVQPRGTSAQCWDGTWKVEVTCVPISSGWSWCDTGDECSPCDPSEPGCNA